MTQRRGPAAIDRPGWSNKAARDWPSSRVRTLARAVAATRSVGDHPGFGAVVVGDERARRDKHTPRAKSRRGRELERGSSAASEHPFCSRHKVVYVGLSLRPFTCRFELGLEAPTDRSLGGWVYGMAQARGRCVCDRCRDRREQRWRIAPSHPSEDCEGLVKGPSVVPAEVAVGARCRCQARQRRRIRVGLVVWHGPSEYLEDGPDVGVRNENPHSREL